MQTKLSVLVLSIGLATEASIAAHHYFAAAFDATSAIRLTGALTKIDWKNPHLLFYLDVKDDNGSVASWACEGGAPGALSRRGLKPGDIKLGDTISVDGYRAKNGSRLIAARRLTLPGGRVVSSPLAGEGGSPDPG